MSALTTLAHRVGRTYISKITSAEAARQSFTRTNERPIEYGFVFSWLNSLQPKTVLDVGTGESALPALVRTCGHVVTAIDNVHDYWKGKRGLVNRHWPVQHEDIREPARQSFDCVLCISVLEHIADPLRAIRGLYDRTRPTGTVILTTPFGAIGHPNVYTEPDSYGTQEPYICRQSSPTDLENWLRVGFTLEHAEYWRAFDSPYWSVGNLIRPLQPSPTPAHLGCFVLRRF